MPSEKPPIFAKFPEQPERVRYERAIPLVLTYLLPLFVIATATGCFDYSGEYTKAQAIQHTVRIFAILAALKFHAMLRAALA